MQTRIRLHTFPYVPTADEACEEYRRCQDDVARFLAALEVLDMPRALEIRRRISLRVPPGVYEARIRPKGQPAIYWVYGVRRVRRRCDLEGAFCVCYLVRERDGKPYDEYEVAPLLGSEGFLTPIFVDRYHGAHAWKVGDIL